MRGKRLSLAETKAGRVSDLAEFVFPLSSSRGNYRLRAGASAALECSPRSLMRWSSLIDLTQISVTVCTYPFPPTFFPALLKSPAAGVEEASNAALLQRAVHQVGIFFLLFFGSRRTPLDNQFQGGRAASQLSPLHVHTHAYVIRFGVADLRNANQGPSVTAILMSRQSSKTP